MITAGIDVGGTKCLGVLFDGKRMVAERRASTPPSGADLLDAIASLVSELSQEASPVALGVGLPGLVDRNGVLRVAPNLPGAAGLAIGPALAAMVGMPVSVDNDATCATWAEFRLGAAVGCQDGMMVTLGTGIGGGIVISGRLLRGAHGFAGEVGHMVVNPGGPQCPCGRSGCWERYASGSGLAYLARKRCRSGGCEDLLSIAGGLEALRGEHVARAAAEGDHDALAVITTFASWVALGLANLVSIVDPSVVVVGGGLVTLGDALLVPVRSELDRLLETEGRPPVALVGARLGERAGALGAAALAAELAGSRP